MKKRLLAGILSIFMICSAFNLTVFGLGFPMGGAVYSDESEWLSAEQIAVLYRSGVSEWEKISLMGDKAEKIVTRAQAAKYISRFAGLNEAKAGEFEALFKDLTSEHECYGAIKAVVSAGYMQGDPDGEFRPDEPITTMEAATVLLRCLDYQPIITMSGINKAFKMTSILDGVPTQDKIVTTQLFRMLYNALISPAISSKAYALLKDGNIAVDYVIDDNYLGFQHLLGLKYEMAILDGIPGTTLKSPDNTLKENRVTIAGIEYEYEGDASELLGYSVKYFYRETSDKRRELVYMYKSDRNEELVLTHDIIDGFSNGVYTYEYKNSTRKVSISGIPIFNGVANTYYKDSEMVPEFGKVTLINNDNDSAYDVVKIDSYEFYLSSKVLSSEKIIYCDDINENTVIIDLKDADYSEIWAKGDITALNRVKANQLLAVRESSDSTPGFKKIVIECVQAEKSNADVTAIKKDTVTLGGSVLNVWDALDGYLEMGKFYNAYIYQDILVFVVELDGEASTVYLLDYGVKDEGFGAKSAQIAVVDTSQNYKMYDVYEKVSVDGISYTKSTLDTIRGALMTSAQLSAGYKAAYPVAQPVKIELNGKGQVKKIDTFTYNEGVEEETSIKPAVTYDASGNLINVGTNQLVYNVRNNVLYYTGSTADSYYRLVAGIGTAKKLFVPMTNRTEIDIYKVDGGLTHDKPHTVDVIGIDEVTGQAETVFGYYDASVLATNISPSIVAELYEELNADGDVECIVKAYQGSNLNTLICEKDLYDTLNIGDIYTFAVSPTNEILNYQKRYSPVEGLAGAGMVSAASSSGYLSEVSGSIMGTAMATATGTLKVALIMPEDINQYTDWKNVAVDLFNISTTPIYKFSKVNGVPKVEKVSVADLVTYSQDPAKASLVIVNKETAMGQVYIIER